MSTIPFGIIAMLMGSVAVQVAGVFLMPLNKGFTAPLPTIGTILCFGTGVFLLSRSLHSGANLSIALPLVSAAIPLCAIFVGIFAFGDPASFARVAVLVAACVAIAVASYL
ncbi:DMT family transporter [Pseudothauera rhizosphaerae]|nr:hypothetical protein [Pseudothauera rhizosphaerae]